METFAVLTLLQGGGVPGVFTEIGIGIIRFALGSKFGASRRCSKLPFIAIYSKEQITVYNSSRYDHSTWCDLYGGSSSYSKEQIIV